MVSVTDDPDGLRRLPKLLPRPCVEKLRVGDWPMKESVQPRDEVSGRTFRSRLPVPTIEVVRLSSERRGTFHVETLLSAFPSDYPKLEPDMLRLFTFEDSVSFRTKCSLSDFPTLTSLDRNLRSSWRS